MSVGRLGPDGHERLRTIRLRGLRDAPDAFGSTDEREVAFTDAVSLHRLRPDGNPHDVSDAADGTPNGIAAGTPDDTTPHTANLVGMWAEPAAPGTGVADALIDEVMRWAARGPDRAPSLHATEGNVRAERACRRHGFRRTGRLTEFETERDVRSVSSPAGSRWCRRSRRCWRRSEPRAR